MLKKDYKVAIYLRLSREDGDDAESESIINQRDYIYRYISKMTEKIICIDEYIDDGFSGGNFDRPSWKKLLSDIKSKKINTIITKDLSRMGRDYIKMGEYIEKIFPENNIRYIAINDDIDTLYETPGLEFLQFKLLFNDFYLKDTSKKIRKIIKSKKEQGQFLGWKAIYGYKKDPNNKYKLVVDENVRFIIKRIFKLALENKSPRQIANILSNDGIPNPSVYAKLNRGKTTTASNLWCPRTIEEMLTNEVYIGNLTQGKRKKINYKSKKEIRVPKEEWIITKNNHEAIIDNDTFYTVQELLKKNKNKTNSKNNELLSGFMFCYECGHAIGINKSSDGKRKYCCCTFYASHSKYKLCTPHSCNYYKLENMVLNELRKLCQKYVNVSNIEKKVKELIKNDSAKNKLIKEIRMIDNKINNNINYIDKIYEDKLNEVIDNKMYERLTLKYQEGINLLEQEKDNLKKELDKNSKIINEKENIIDKINKFLLFEKPSRDLLVNLIDKIYISQNKQIEIYYKFKI